MLALFSSELGDKRRIHDECALFFLIFLITKECVVIDGLGTSELLVYIHDLLLEIIQAVAVSHDVVSDVSFEVLNARNAALEKRMKNDFLRSIHTEHVLKPEVMTHL
jgi:uncharacterized protein YqhQ